ncbi:hypothetical protein R1sor_025961 [Riccia sorocarpa]|uniref:Uncharacterized protein n=1 Tax=Riccia sorocarpa TaxID=122646 RepID=A0ABD3GAM5_9MARC
MKQQSDAFFKVGRVKKTSNGGSPDQPMKLELLKHMADVTLLSKDDEEAKDERGDNTADEPNYSATPRTENYVNPEAQTRLHGAQVGNQRAENWGDIDDDDGSLEYLPKVPLARDILYQTVRPQYPQLLEKVNELHSE